MSKLLVLAFLLFALPTMSQGDADIPPRSVRADLRRLADALESTLAETGADLQARESLFQKLASVARRLRADKALNGSTRPLLRQLETLLEQLRHREDVLPYSRSLARHLILQLRWSAGQRGREAELLAFLDSELDCLRRGEEVLPEDIPLEEFLRLGPLRIFMMKHRLRFPRRTVASTVEELRRGKLNVATGIEVTGLVTERSVVSFDGDVTFDIPPIHMEITPEWRLRHPEMPLPKVGDRVRVRGWTYYDSFHKFEEEYDARHPILGKGRASLWEIHPVQEVEIIR